LGDEIRKLSRVKVHLNQIPAEGRHIEGEEDCPITDVEAEEIRCIGQLSYKIDIGVSGGALWATGLLRQSVELRCVACLEKFMHEIKVPAFALRTELHGPETVDLTPFMREDLLLNLPAHPRCDRDGGRVCRATQREAMKEEVRKPDWSALDKLKLKS
jgi:uncharacterized metal-binding protein YceD (DUF177 family)